jgi:glycosyltransferase involved in cell wall biosynthesis
MVRVGIVVEYLIGHITYAESLRRALAGHPDVVAHQYDLGWPYSGLVERLPPIRHNWSLRSSVRTRALLERAPRLDAALIHTQTASLLSVGFMRRVPTLISADATPRQFDRIGAAYGHDTHPDRVEEIKAAIVGRAYRAAHRVIAWTDWVRRSLIDEYRLDPERVIVLHPGTRLPDPPPAKNGHPRRILFVGGEFERKGGEDLLAALGDAAFDWELDVVTRSHLEPRPGVRVHRDLASSDPRLAELYAAADAFALPTRGEAVPHVVAEAMAAGLPVVSTEVGAIPDLVDADSGLLVAPGDVAALRDGLTTLFADPARCRAMGAAGRARAERILDAEVNMGRTLDLLLAAAGDQRA